MTNHSNTKKNTLSPTLHQSCFSSIFPFSPHFAHFHPIHPRLNTIPFPNHHHPSPFLARAHLASVSSFLQSTTYTRIMGPSYNSLQDLPPPVKFLNTRHANSYLLKSHIIRIIHIVHYITPDIILCSHYTDTDLPSLQHSCT